MHMPISYRSVRPPIRSLLVLLFSLPLVRGCEVSSAVPDESRLYYLPFAAGSAYLVQAIGFGQGGHDGYYAVDFAIPEGVKVLASRDGTVVDVVENCPNEDSSEPIICSDNLIAIRHEDGSIARYRHLQPGGSCINVGDEVLRGDVIGVSGNRGRTLQPHLHFEVLASEGQTGSGRCGPSNNGTMEIQFADVPGDGYAMWLHIHRSLNQVNRDFCSQ